MNTTAWRKFATTKIDDEAPERNYRLQDGTRPASVTEVIRANLGWDRDRLDAWKQRTADAGEDPDVVADNAATYGKTTHNVIRRWLRGDSVDVITDQVFLFRPVHERMAAMANLDAFIAWHTRRQVTVLANEQPLVSELNRIAGTPDLIMRMAGVDGVVVTDHKTGNTITDAMTVQLGAYAMLWQEHTGHNEATSGCVLRIANGQCKELMATAAQVFTGALLFANVMNLHRMRKDVHLDS